MPSGHPLLGQRLPVGGNVFSRKLSLPTAPFLRDHVVRGTVLFPAAGFIELAIAAARTLEPDAAVELQHVMIKAALPIDDRQIIDLQTSIDREAHRFAVRSRLETADQYEKQPYVDHVDGMMMFSPNEHQSVDIGALHRRIRRSLSVDDHYVQAAARGLNYGLAFRTVTELRLGEDELLARVRRTSDAASDYHLDPTIIDGALQAIIAFGVTHLSDDLFLPVRFDRLLALGTTRGITDVVVHVVKRAGNRGYLTCDLKIVSDKGDLIAEMSGMQVRRVGNSEATHSNLYEDVLEPVFSFGQPFPQISPSAVLDEPSATPFKGRNEVTDEILDLCDGARAAFVATAFRKLAGSKPFSLAELVAGGSLAPQHARYAAVMLEDAADSEYVTQHDGLYQATSNADPWPIWRSLYARYPQYMADLLGMAQVGRHLAEILSGSLTAQEVLFSQSGSGFLEQLYENGFSCGPFNTVARDALARLVDAVPADRRIRVLEIGAGTGGTTGHLLPVMPQERSQYVFSDVSPAFFATAEKRFGSFPSFRTQTLDIAKQPDLEALGGPFDVVVAANSLHATPDLVKTLSNVRASLVPGGMLFLLEVAPAAQPTFQFGLLTGFWDFEDHETRTENCMVSAQDWRNLLARAGFDEVAVQTEFSPRGREIASVIVASCKRQELVPSHSTTQEFATQSKEAPVLVVVDRAPQDLQRAIVETYGANQTPITVLASLETESAGLGYSTQRCATAEPAEALNTLNAAPPREVIFLAPDGKLREPVGNDEGWFFVSLIKAVARATWSAAPTLTIVTAGLTGPSTNIHGAAAWAVGRTVSNEYATLQCRRIDVERSTAAFQRAAQVIAAGRSGGPKTLSASADEVLITANGIYVPRLDTLPPERIERRAAAGPQSPFVVGLPSQGSIDKLDILPRNKPLQVRDSEIEIAVEAASLNFRDVISALGLLPPEMMLDSSIGFLTGFEAAGTVIKAGVTSGFVLGDRVMAMAGGSLASSVIASGDLARLIPKSWTFEDAATIPAVGLTVFYALKMLARLSEGETLLVHGGAGGVGLTAVSYAKSIGAKVIATAGSSDKRTLLEAIGVDLVLDSRSLSFAQDVREFTGGDGVDVVLNSLAGDAMYASLSLLKPFARFVEIGKRDFEANSNVGLRMLHRNISYFAFDLTFLHDLKPAAVREAWQHVLDAIDAGTLRPLPRRVLPFVRVKEAFRFLQAGRNIGKVTITNDRTGLTLKSPRRRLPDFAGEGTHIITGGLGGLGLRVARWLVERGARQIVLVGRRGITSAEQQEAVDAMLAEGAKVSVEEVDVADAAQTAALIKRLRSRSGTIRGVFHSVLTLADTMLIDLDRAGYEEVMAAKVQGAVALNELLWNDKLDYFVCFSSFANTMGNPGQANYNAANAILEAIMIERRRSGRHGLALCLGPVSDFGFVARNKDKISFEHAGVLDIRAADVTRALDDLIESDRAVASVVLPTGRSLLPISSSYRLADVMRSSGQSPELNGGEARIDLRTIAPSERTKVIEGVLVSALAQVTGLKQTRIDTEKSFAAAGMDSLMAVEMGLLIEQRLGTAIPLADFAHDFSIRERARAICSRLGLETDGGDPQIAEGSVRGEGQSIIVPLTKHAAPVDDFRIFGVHGVMGSAGSFAALAEELSSHCRFFGVQAGGVIAPTGSVKSHEEVVETCTSAINAEISDGPVVVLGWSYGGIVANDIACRLKEQGKRVEALIVFDAVQDTPDTEHADASRGSADYRSWGEAVLRSIARSVAGISFDQRQARAADVYGKIKEGVDLDTIVDGLFETKGTNRAEVEQRQVIKLGLSFVSSLNTRPAMPTFDGPILLVRAADTREIVKDPLYGWGARRRAVDAVDVSSQHLNLLDPAAIPDLASAIRSFLAAHRIGADELEDA